jgi:hypothetical protein
MKSKGICFVRISFWKRLLNLAFFEEGEIDTSSVDEIKNVV